MNGRRALAVASVAALATLGLLVALRLPGSAQGWALLAYVLSLGALALVAVFRGLCGAVPAERPFEQLLMRQQQPAEPIEQLERLKWALQAATWSDAELRHRLRPHVREIVSTRLWRAHGVDLDRQPVRARALVGDDLVWELAAPETEPRQSSRTSGLSRAELRALIGELEAL